ncbi:MAG: hypothetical protein FJW40_19710 [Acidobacteria bacterium]|nr:hypothetical protein [Acidobacteriota bacterium]
MTASSTASTLAPGPVDLMLSRCGAWLVHSGIQKPSGGFARYRRADLGRNERTSTEITAYAVCGLLHLHKTTREPVYRDAAARAGEFLLGAWDAGIRAFPFETADEMGQPEPLSYFFDTGIIARALLRLWRTTGSQQYLDAAALAGESMRRDFRTEIPGRYHPILALPSKEPLPYAAAWSRRPGCFHLKAALAWRELHEATGDAAFEAEYDAAVCWSVANREGFLTAEPARERVMDRLHAFCYFLEGLLPVAAAHRGVMEAGIEEAARELRAVRDLFSRSDVYAQLLRVRLLGGLGVDMVSALEEARSLEPFQAESSDSQTNGTFLFGQRQGVLAAHPNPVSTVFAMQALQWWREFMDGKLRAGWRDLI